MRKRKVETGIKKIIEIAKRYNMYYTVDTTYGEVNLSSEYYWGGDVVRPYRRGKASGKITISF